MNYVIKSLQALGKEAKSHHNAIVMRKSLFCDEKFVWVCLTYPPKIAAQYLKVVLFWADSFRNYVNICILLRQYFVLYFFGDKAFLWLNVIIYFKGILEKVSIPNFFVNLETKVIILAIGCPFRPASLTGPIRRPWSFSLDIIFLWLWCKFWTCPYETEIWCSSWLWHDYPSWFTKSMFAYTYQIAHITVFP